MERLILGKKKLLLNSWSIKKQLVAALLIATNFS